MPLGSGCFSDEEPPMVPDSSSDSGSTSISGPTDPDASGPGTSTDAGVDDATGGGTCGDGVENGDETDVDCGGSCDGCGEGQACDDDADCGSADCYVGTCAPECVSWVTQYGTPGSDEARGMIIDEAGDLYVAGRAEGSLEGNTDAGDSDLFVTKLDPDANRLFTRQLGTPTFDMSESVAIHSDGSFLVVGRSDGDFDGHTGFGAMDGIAIRYDELANEQWSVQLGTPLDDRIRAVALSNNGRGYLAGYTAGSYGGNVNGGSADLLLVKLDDDGTELWSRQLGGPGLQAGNGVVVDSENNVIVAGNSSGPFEGGMAFGGNDAIVVKLDGDGAILWTAQIGGEGSDVAHDVTVDADDNVYIVGLAENAYDQQEHLGDRDMVVTKLDAAGVTLWSAQFGTSDFDDAYGIAVDAEGMIYVSGHSRGNLGDKVVAGAEDLSVVALDPEGEVAWVELIGSPTDELFRSIAVGPMGEIYASGYTRGDLDGSNAGSADIVVARICPPQ